MFTNKLGSIKQKRLFFFEREVILLKDRIIYLRKTPIKNSRYVVKFEEIDFVKTFSLKGFYSDEKIKRFGIIYALFHIYLWCC